MKVTAKCFVGSVTVRSLLNSSANCEEGETKSPPFFTFFWISQDNLLSLY